MPKPTGKDKNQIKQDSDLKGTLASVLLLGIFLIVIWISIYFLFTGRLG